MERNRKMRKIDNFEKFLKMKVCIKIKKKYKKTAKKTLILNKNLEMVRSTLLPPCASSALRVKFYDWLKYGRRVDFSKIWYTNIDLYVKSLYSFSFYIPAKILIE